MAASRYEISLLVLKKYFTRSRNIFQHSKRNFVSRSGHVISFIYYMNLKKSIVIFLAWIWRKCKQNTTSL